MKRLSLHLNPKGQVIAWPSHPKAQMIVLEFLADKFKLEVPYSERQINETLNRFHAFSDPALLRRELFIKRFIDRERDGSKYWRPKRQLASAWSTKRLITADSRAEEISPLQKIYDRCRYIAEWTGHQENRSNPMEAEFKHETIPENLDKKLHRLQSIKTKEGAELIGYCGLYHGFPDEPTVWIGVLAIDPSFQKREFGREMIQGLTEEVMSLRTFRRIGLSVSLKNWPAIRFWVACGFHRIDKFTGSRTCREDTFAEIWLMKSLGQDVSS